MCVLEEVIPKSSDVVVIYPAIWTFAHLLEKSDMPANKAIFSCIERYIGTDTTLIYPSFCAADFVKTKIYDLKKSIPRESGILSITALTNKNYTRTKNPMHSFLVKGRKTNEILSLASSTSWGNDSILGWMQDVNATICPLGLPWHRACSLFHRAEENLQAPYRYYKKFNGAMYDNGRYVQECSEVKFSYPLSTNIKFDYSIATSVLTKNYPIKSSSDSRIMFQSAQAQDIVEACEKLLSEDIYAYVVNRNDAIDWVENKKEEEVSHLSLDEIYIP
jgi:aminoglycoside 3-N-acetyltransferase